MMIEEDQQQKIKFYTTGYASKNINDLKPMLDAVPVDVRN
jgi:hypothetical protein